MQMKKEVEFTSKIDAILLVNHSRVQPIPEEPAQAAQEDRPVRKKKKEVNRSAVFKTVARDEAPIYKLHKPLRMNNDGYYQKHYELIHSKVPVADISLRQSTVARDGSAKYPSCMTNDLECSLQNRLLLKSKKNPKTLRLNPILASKGSGLLEVPE